MMETAIVKVFFGKASRNGKRSHKGQRTRRGYGFGFAEVIDANGVKTGEEIFFTLPCARQLEVRQFHVRSGGGYNRVECVTFSNVRATLDELGSEPLPGEFIAFQAPKVFSPKRRAEAWTYSAFWRQMEDMLSDKDGKFGVCSQCRHALTESEFAIGDICDGCKPAYMARWQTNQEALQEAADEARRYPEVSDDDYDDYPDWCGRHRCYYNQCGC